MESGGFLGFYFKKPSKGSFINEFLGRVGSEALLHFHTKEIFLYENFVTEGGPKISSFMNGPQIKAFQFKEVGDLPSNLGFGVHK